jgi:isopentenyl-diphosphate delta-isomerase
MEDKVILVDEQDNETGLMFKTEAHQKAMLHRAVSVCIFNSAGEWLLQRRSATKYHSPGLWTNTSCTHPLPGESNLEAAQRRLIQEMGMQCSIKEVFSFVYKEKLDRELSEHEFDHVFIGVTDNLPVMNPAEVADYKYISFASLHADVLEHPDHYTVWFRKIYEQVQQQFLIQV